MQKEWVECSQGSTGQLGCIAGIAARALQGSIAALPAWPASRSVLLGRMPVFQEALHLVHCRPVCGSHLALLNSMQVVQEALQHKPHSATDAWLLAQIYCSRGKVAEAFQLADALTEAAPDSADVQALRLLLCQLPQQQGDPQSQAERLLDLLRMDPGSQEAVSGANVAHRHCK